jgi:tRNA/tmRNA/rRNA uracil-C5-methylase (TrmA/RlmC/RlmD family)
MNLPSGCQEACPGCRYRELSAEESDRRKQAWVEACLAPLGVPVRPLRAPGLRSGYRRKVLLHAARREGGSWHFGLLRRTGFQRREAELVPIPDCPLHAPGVNELLMDLRTLLPAGIPLAFVQVSGPILTLVLKCAPNPAWRAWAAAQEAPLRRAGAESLQLNWNPVAGRRALSSRHQEPVFGPPFARDADGLRHGALSFRQQVAELENEALALAERFLAAAGVAQVVDLYSGTGASLRRWRALGWRAAGVELVGEACAAAEENAPGALVLKGRVEERVPQLTEFVAGDSFTLYTNPPRDGHAAPALAWIEAARPRRIAYLSCNPRSLARDLTALAAGYAIESVQPFDFFPGTDHVESLALLRAVDSAPSLG